MKKNEQETIKKIKEQIDMIKPFIMDDGGILEFVKFEDGICYVSLGGACENCGLIDYTLKDSIEQIITGEVPEVKEVRKI